MKPPLFRSGRSASAFAPSHENRARGLAAKRAGDDFERDLDATHAAYEAAGAAMIYRSHPAVVVQGGRPIAFAKKGGVDYVGVAQWPGDMLPNPIAVAFDAKSRGGGASFKLKADGKHDEREQARSLLAFTVAGGLGFFLVRDVEAGRTDAGRVYAVGGRENLALLAFGDSVPLRCSTRGTLAGAPLVPCLALALAGRVRAIASGAPLVDWIALLPALLAS